MYSKIIFIIAPFFIITSCSAPYSAPKIKPLPIVSTGSIQTGIEYTQTGQTNKERLDESKRRKNFRSVIRKGDYFSLKNDRETALRYYLNAHLRLKDDNMLERKIA